MSQRVPRGNFNVDKSIQHPLMLFKNASRWSWHDDDFIGSIVQTLQQLLVGVIKVI